MDAVVPGAAPGAAPGVPAKGHDLTVPRNQAATRLLAAADVENIIENWVWTINPVPSSINITPIRTSFTSWGSTPLRPLARKSSWIVRLQSFGTEMVHHLSWTVQYHLSGQYLSGQLGTSTCEHRPLQVIVHGGARHRAELPRGALKSWAEGLRWGNQLDVLLYRMYIYIYIMIIIIVIITIIINNITIIITITIIIIITIIYI